MCYDYVGKVCAFFFLCLLDFLRWDPVVLQSGERDDVDGFGWSQKIIANQDWKRGERRSP